MSRLAAVAERLAQTRRWLDQEADRLAARLDQLEKRAPAAIQTAHRILDEHQRELDATEMMVQQWLNATADLSAAAGKRPLPQAGAGAPGRSPPKVQESVSAPVEPVRRALDDQQKDVGKLERALQTLASALPEPPIEAAGQSAQPQARQSVDAALDSRLLLDEQQKHDHRDEGGLERALQTLASKQNASAAQSARPRPAAVIAEAPGADQQPRKLGVVRVA
jgi:hypothetical protein